MIIHDYTYQILGIKKDVDSQIAASTYIKSPQIDNLIQGLAKDQANVIRHNQRQYNNRLHFNYSYGSNKKELSKVRKSIAVAFCNKLIKDVEEANSYLIWGVEFKNVKEIQQLNLPSEDLYTFEELVERRQILWSEQDAQNAAFNPKDYPIDKFCIEQNKLIYPLFFKQNHDNLIHYIEVIPSQLYISWETDKNLIHKVKELQDVGINPYSKAQELRKLVTGYTETIEGTTIERIIHEDVKSPYIYLVTDKGVFKIHPADYMADTHLADGGEDLQDLIGQKIIEFSERSNQTMKNPGQDEDTQTWTFYNIRTLKSTVSLRFYSTCNGYYSEDIMLQKLKITTELFNKFF